MTQARLAELADVDPKHLQKIESAATNPTLETIVAIAEALGVEPSELLKHATLAPPCRGRPKR